jgi:alpha-L-fucosidase
MTTLASFRTLCTAAVGLLTAAPLISVPSSASDVAVGDRLAWYREAKLGLFIHWALFSVPGGIYEGQQVDGLGEWIMYNAKIPVAKYAGYATQFNPVKFDADGWVRLTRDAGVKYIVITAKHHEGFAMFKSRASPFNIVDSTPFKRDPLKELAAACEKYGIRLGFYYSQAQDWHHPGGAAWGRHGESYNTDPEAGHWDKAQDGDFDSYIDTVAIPQVRELLSNYGRISVLWWDTPVGMTPARAARFAEVLKLQPDIVTNNRLLNPDQGNAYSGDTETPEQFIPATGLGNRLFEVCMTMNDTWGFKSYDRNWKSAPDIIRKLVDIASKGGNFLLNIGPGPDGEIPEASAERLLSLGAWLRVNHESIYATDASLFRRLPWGRSTTKGNTIYLHVFDWPSDGVLVVPGLKSAVIRASLLASGETVPVTTTHGANVIVMLPTHAPDPVASVIKLEIACPPVVEQVLPSPDAKGEVSLSASLAAVVNAYSANARLIGSGPSAYIGGWDKPGTTLNWEFVVAKPVTLRVLCEAAVAGPCSILMTCGSSKSTTMIHSSGGLNDYREANLGIITIASNGEQKLELESRGSNWGEVRLRGVRLVPAR